MYAIIETGGKQYRVELGTELEVERLAGEPGGDVVIDRVLLVADEDWADIGRPFVAGAEVRASVLRQDRGEKIVVFKYKPKTRSRKKRGHRQELTVLRVADIVHEGRSAAKDAAATARQSEAERAKAAREAADQAARDAALAAELAAKASAAKGSPAKAEAKPAAKRQAKAKVTTKPETKATMKPEATTKPKAKPPKPKAKASDTPTAKAEATDREAAAPKADKGATGSKAATPEKTDNTKRPTRRPRKET